MRSKGRLVLGSVTLSDILSRAHAPQKSSALETWEGFLKTQRVMGKVNGKKCARSLVFPRCFARFVNSFPSLHSVRNDLKGAWVRGRCVSPLHQIMESAYVKRENDVAQNLLALFFVGHRVTFPFRKRSMPF